MDKCFDLNVQHTVKKNQNSSISFFVFLFFLNLLSGSKFKISHVKDDLLENCISLNVVKIYPQIAFLLKKKGLQYVDYMLVFSRCIRFNLAYTYSAWTLKKARFNSKGSGRARLQVCRNHRLNSLGIQLAEFFSRRIRLLECWSGTRNWSPTCYSTATAATSRGISLPTPRIFSTSTRKCASTPPPRKKTPKTNKTKLIKNTTRRI